jgi:hypothetical protein
MHIFASQNYILLNLILLLKLIPLFISQIKIYFLLNFSAPKIYLKMVLKQNKKKQETIFKIKKRGENRPGQPGPIRPQVAQPAQPAKP